ncbi:MAG TPA: ACT domain-containing protein [Pyrinomonadaceae bacterium]|nr:ACT domain-containing protein [Pyrinomonadaceae bacterium]
MSVEQEDDRSPAGLLRRARVEVAPETFTLVGLRHQDWLRLTENAELGPSRHASFMMLRDEYEVTLLLGEDDWRAMRHLARDARIEGDFRIVTLNVELDWNVVGFMAHVAAILAAAQVSCGFLSAFARDHLLIKQGDLPRALLALGPHVAELC